jgi:diguanylate cyclase (GGDEF)-like protein
MNIKRYPVNLKKYLAFFQYVTNKSGALAIINHKDNFSLLSESGIPEDFDKLINQFNRSTDLRNIFFNSDHQFINIDSIGSVAKAPLQIAECEHPVWLLGFMRHSRDGLHTVEYSNVQSTLINIAECIIDDYTIQKTLTDTINELTVRYEELNLLYGLDDVDTHRIEFDEIQALSQIINNCCDYLNVDMAYVHAPKLSINLLKLNTSKTEFNISSIEHYVQNSLYRQVVSEQSTLVINQADEIICTDYDFIEEVKLIAAPIKMDKRNVDGVLVIANSKQKTDFSNSDRKLLDVLAAEAGKLIQARRDSITGLLNRRGFSEKLHQALSNTNQNGTKNSLLFIDIDQFKIVNESTGQHGGDQLLNHVASILNSWLDNIFAIGRLGADEFGIILADCSLEQAEHYAENLSQTINQFRFSHQNKLFDISICIGLVELNSEVDDYFVPLSLANLACNIAKENGRNRIHVYHSTDKEMLRHENDVQWVSRINLALEEQRFQLYRQKIQPLQAKNELEEHYEILIRLKDETGNLITPFAFIPAAERYNLMPKLDRWVVNNTLAKMKEFINKVTETKLFCSINLSGQSFTDPGFVEFVIEQITNSGVPPECVCFEITETAAVSNLTQTVKFMESVKEIGCYFSLDDFGSGMSSFTYLKNLPVDYLKIDGYFVKTMLTNNIDFAMVRSIHEIGHVMGLKTVAEFVEDDNIKSALTNLGVDYGQGYGIAKPEPFEV